MTDVANAVKTEPHLIVPSRLHLSIQCDSGLVLNFQLSFPYRLSPGESGRRGRLRRDWSVGGSPVLTAFWSVDEGSMSWYWHP